MAVTWEKLRQYTSASSTVCEGVFWDKTGATYKNTKAVRKYCPSVVQSPVLAANPTFKAFLPTRSVGLYLLDCQACSSVAFGFRLDPGRG